MQTFKDAKGVEWRLQMLFGQRKPILAMFSVDLLTLYDDHAKGLRDLIYNRIPDFIDLVYYLVKDQAEERGISDEQFGMQLDPNSVIAARDAFVREAADFFPDDEVRSMNRAALAKMTSLARAVIADRLAKLAEIDEHAMVPEIVKRLEAGRKSPGDTLANSE